MREETPRLTKQQAVIIGAMTGVLCGDFPDLHGYIEGLLGRPVMTHEMADETVMSKIKEAARDDFMAILPEGTKGL